MRDRNVVQIFKVKTTKFYLEQSSKRLVPNLNINFIFNKHQIIHEQPLKKQNYICIKFLYRDHKHYYKRRREEYIHKMNNNIYKSNIHQNTVRYTIPRLFASSSSSSFSRCVYLLYIFLRRRYDREKNVFLSWLSYIFVVGSFWRETSFAYYSRAAKLR